MFSLRNKKIFFELSLYPLLSAALMDDEYNCLKIDLYLDIWISAHFYHKIFTLYSYEIKPSNIYTTNQSNKTCYSRTQRLKHLCNHKNIFETKVVQANEC